MILVGVDMPTVLLSVAHTNSRHLIDKEDKVWPNRLTDAHERPTAAVNEEERGPFFRMVVWNIHTSADSVEQVIRALHI